ncbi:AzlC family ABC transporter permease [Mycetohabitans rhizoxinica]|uniref:AzlC family ABC transporter permease n=2 Tax=Mycetohabitans rhizoxinica TaxID=412963 RepID=A0ABZ2PVA4_9BURK
MCLPRGSRRCNRRSPARSTQFIVAAMFQRLSDIDRRAFVEGVRTCAPTFAAMFSWGLVTGIAMSKSVLTVPQSLGMSLLVYAGSSQLAVLPLLAAKLPMWTVLLTAAMINTRFIVFSAGLAPHFSYLSMPRRLLLGYFNGDVIYLLFQARGFKPGYEPGKEAFFWGMAASSWIMWQASSIIGILLASLFPDDWGLSLAGTLALIPIMVSAIVGRSTLVAVVIAAIVALVSIDMPYRLSLPLAILAALLAGLASDTYARNRSASALRRAGQGGRVSQ